MTNQPTQPKAEGVQAEKEGVEIEITMHTAEWTSVPCAATQWRRRSAHSFTP
jgi:hypothetical protein